MHVLDLDEINWNCNVPVRWCQVYLEVADWLGGLDEEPQLDSRKATLLEHGLKQSDLDLLF